MKEVYLIPDRAAMKESLELLKKYGGNYEYNDFFAANILEDKKKQLEIIEEYARFRSDFSRDTIHGAFLDVTVHSTDPLIRQVSELRVRQSMELAKEMGVRGIVFHTNRIFGFREAEYLSNWKKKNETFFKRVAEEFPSIEIYMENMFDEAPDVLAEFAENMRDVSTFGICLDYAHAAAFGKKSHEWIRCCAPYIKHMHINDNDLQEDLHLAVGQGKINWEQWQKELEENHVSATVLIEVKGVEKQRASLEYMKQKKLI